MSEVPDSWSEIPPEVHECSEGPDSLVGFYCTWCYVRWPCYGHEREVAAAKLADVTKAAYFEMIAKGDSPVNWLEVAMAAIHEWYEGVNALYIPWPSRPYAEREDKVIHTPLLEVDISPAARKLTARRAVEGAERIAARPERDPWSIEPKAVDDEPPY